jgi:branched-chain amino acid transport system substrate-binding protein
MRLIRRATAFLFATAALTTASIAQTPDTPGVTATEIKLGQTVPLSGPVSAYATFSRASLAYFAMVNDRGGINGRKVTLISIDDGFSPPKTVEQTRKLVESNGVFAIFAPVGSAPSAATQKYLNGQKVPQLLIQSGLARWNNPKEFPWSMSGLLTTKSKRRLTGNISSTTSPSPGSRYFTKAMISAAPILTD